jgi:hypothetical protein
VWSLSTQHVPNKEPFVNSTSRRPILLSYRVPSSPYTATYSTELYLRALSHTVHARLMSGHEGQRAPSPRKNNRLIISHNEALNLIMDDVVRFLVASTTLSLYECMCSLCSHGAHGVYLVSRTVYVLWTLYFRFSVPCIFYRLQINVPTDATNFISLFRMFPFTLQVSSLYWPIIRGVLSCCYATIWLLPCLLAVRASVEVALPYGRATSTDAWQEPNGSIATAQDTPDDGPVEARNM